MDRPPLPVVLISPRGFCAGVERAIAIVERVLALHGSPVYVKHEIVHNTTVIRDLKAKGVVFVDTIDAIPQDNRPVIFSAHGVSQAVRGEAVQRGFHVIDATCPLVTKVHVEVQRAVARGVHVVFIGHPTHPEAEGTLGQAPAGTVSLVETTAEAERIDLSAHPHLAYVTQTTLSVFDTHEVVKTLQRRYPHIEGPKRQDICFATENRQRALASVAQDLDACVVIGSANSSNTTRLYELAARLTKRKLAWRIDDPLELPCDEIATLSSLGVTAGASAPRSLIDATLDRLRHHVAITVRDHVVIEENVRFAMPRNLEASLPHER